MRMLSWSTAQSSPLPLPRVIIPLNTPWRGNLEDLGKELEMILGEEWERYPEIVEKKDNDTLLDI
jgi:hypothetical protein